MDEKTLKISAIHCIYKKYLDRYAEKDVIERYKTININKLSETLSKSEPSQMVKMVKTYYTFPFKENNRINEIMETYTKYLYYLPKMEDLLQLNIIDIPVFNYINEKDDYIYLQECKKNFKNLSKVVNQKSGFKPKIKFYGSVGTSGYSKVCRDIISSIYKDFDIYFEIIQFHNYLPDSEDNFLLSDLYNKPKLENYDFIVIHSMPELWPTIRKDYPSTYIYGITVWETEILPDKWEMYTSFVDKVSVPSKFSSLAFDKINLTVDVVHHPVILNKSEIDDTCKIKELKKKYDYVFYTINEWTNRKGITELIESFNELFKNGESSVLLYIKTFGDIPVEEAKRYIKGTYNIIIDYTRVSDSYINCIHDCGDCYISLTKAEGHGLGICQATLLGKHIIAPLYSGYLDYIYEQSENEGISFLPVEMEPATFCSFKFDKHRDCISLPHCKYFNLFIPSQDHLFSKVKKEDIKKSMLDSYNKKIKTNNNKLIHTFTKEKFCKDFTISLLKKNKNNNKIKNGKEQVLDLYKCKPQSFYFEIPKKNILIINAGGYGNVGDDTYNFIFNRYFSKEYNLIFLGDSDHTSTLLDFDILIIGGGGLLNSERNSLKNNIWIYANFAINNSLPYYLISVGFQDTPFTEITLEVQHTYNSYGYLLDNAQLVSVRSPMDYHISCSIMSSHSKENLYLYPDIAYSLLNFVKMVNYKRDILLVTLDVDWINLKNSQFIVDDIKTKGTQNNLQIVFTDFTGIINGQSKNYDDILKKHFNGFSYKFISGIVTPLDPERTTTYSDILNYLQKTHTIITGRYHGMILSKVFGIPVVETYNYSNYKFQSELMMHNTENSIDQLHRIKVLIDSNIFLKNNLDDNTRNELINKIHEKTGIDIHLIQNWNNRKLQEINFNF